ncbi:phage NrS-1 polymerase family protein [Tautonia plasticadhaerens]|uniref:NrS-1 polymerase-like HBD domain-containing protein n=1 Tax=Tautonia plasticadhaerens TaxID=2527974 RepID=A0A518H3X1_9BACT|nr:AAA family ATPase [Tautonia plasticadhaerens]QDV35529.1 hypothetical protein ElP_34320 [Tautonia plasticadhaerens]
MGALPLGDVPEDADDDSVLPDGSTKPWAAALLRTLDCYAEYSPSGTGLKAFFLGSLEGLLGAFPWVGDVAKLRKKKAYHDGAVEFYGEGTARFFTVTGQRWEGSSDDVGDRQEAFTEVYGLVFAEELEAARRRVERQTEDADPVSPAFSPPDDLDVDDQELLEAAFAAANGSVIKALWEGRWEGTYASHSDADLALLGFLAFWTGPRPDRLDRLFRASGLCVGDRLAKWERLGEATIAKVLGAQQASYDWEAHRGRESRNRAEQERQRRLEEMFRGDVPPEVHGHERIGPEPEDGPDGDRTGSQASPPADPLLDQLRAWKVPVARVRVKDGWTNYLLDHCLFDRTHPTARFYRHEDGASGYRCEACGKKSLAAIRGHLEGNGSPSARQGIAPEQRRRLIIESCLDWDRFDGLAAEAAVRYAAAPWIAMGQEGVLVGPPKAGKTTLCADLGTALLTGTRWLGSVPTRRMNLLVLDYENPVPYIHDKLRRSMAARGGDWAEANGLFHYFDPRRIRELLAPLTYDDMMALIEHAARGSGCDEGLVLIDTARPAFNGLFEDDANWENNSAQVRKALEGPMRAARRSGWAVLVIHHTNKAGKIAGNQDWLGAVDYMIGYERELGAPLSTIRFFGRPIGEPPAPLQYTLRGGLLVDASLKTDEERLEDLLARDGSSAPDRHATWIDQARHLLPVGRENAVKAGAFAQQLQGSLKDAEGRAISRTEARSLVDEMLDRRYCDSEPERNWVWLWLEPGQYAAENRQADLAG